MKKVTCPACGRRISFHPYCKDTNGNRLLNFHFLPETQAECFGSMRSPVAIVRAAWARSIYNEPKEGKK